MNRRTFVKKTVHATSLLALPPALPKFQAEKPFVRLGGPLFATYTGPDEWVAALQKLRYRAAYCPLKTDAPADQIKAYAEAARKADIVMAEVGAWSNPLSSDPATAQAAFKKMRGFAGVSGSHRGELLREHQRLEKPNPLGRTAQRQSDKRYLRADCGHYPADNCGGKNRPERISRWS